MKKTLGIFCILLTVLIAFGHFVRLSGLRYHRLAFAAERNGHKNYSLLYSLKGLRINPYNIRLNGYAAVSLYHQGHADLGLQHLEAMLKYYPHHLNALINAASGYKYLGRMDKFREMNDRIAKIDPGYVKKL